jgi:histone H3/H4
MTEGPQLHQFIQKPVGDESTILDDSVQTQESDAEHQANSTPLKKPVDDDDGNDEDVVDIDEANEDDEEGEEGASGTSVLPLSRIKKIFKTDPEHLGASEAAVFTTAVATELFVQYFAEQASLIARSDKRKKLQYKDFSAAVANIEQLHFLTDTVPPTHNLKGLVEKNKVKYAKESAALEKGQQTLQLGKKTAKGTDEGEESDSQDLGDINDAEVVTDNDSDEGTRLETDHDVIME